MFVYVFPFNSKKKKKTEPISKILFFSCKGMDRQSDMGYIRSFTHNAELQKTPNKRQKTGLIDFQDCIAESNCMNLTKIGSMV